MTGRPDGAALGPFVDELVARIREQVKAAGATGTVVALSGGIDAAVTSALCQLAFPDDNLGVMLHCHSAPADEKDARLFADALGVAVTKVDLTPVYDALAAGLEPASSGGGAAAAGIAGGASGDGKGRLA